jgi:hypothetical protein
MRVPQRGTQLLAAAAMLALAAGCASLTPKEENWTGHKIAELIARRGPADRIMSYPYGGTLYVWERPEGTLMQGGGAFADDASASGNFVHRELVLVSDAGIIVRSEVRTERSDER